MQWENARREVPVQGSEMSNWKVFERRAAPPGEIGTVFISGLHVRRLESISPVRCQVTPSHQCPKPVERLCDAGTSNRLLGGVGGGAVHLPRVPALPTPFCSVVRPEYAG